MLIMIVFLVNCRWSKTSVCMGTRRNCSVVILFLVQFCHAFTPPLMYLFVITPLLGKVHMYSEKGFVGFTIVVYNRFTAPKIDSIKYLYTTYR